MYRSLSLYIGHRHYVWGIYIMYRYFIIMYEALSFYSLELKSPEGYKTHLDTTYLYMMA